MNQEEKIKAYLLNHLTDEEAAAFKAEIQRDPELIAAVTATKLLLIAQELKHRDALIENMKTWHEENNRNPMLETPSFFRKNRWKIAFGLGVILLLLVIGYKDNIHQWLWPNKIINPTVVVPAADIAGSETMDTKKQDLLLLEVSISTEEKLLKFAPSIVQFTVEKEVLPSTMMGSSPIAQRPKSNILRSGFLWEHKQKLYVITNASMVSKVPFERGAVEWKIPNGSSKRLTLIGRNDQYDVAVLEVEKELGWHPTTTVLAEKPAEKGEKAYVFNPLKVGNKQDNGISAGKIHKTSKYFFSAISNTIWKVANGPVFNESGQVIGLITQLDDLPKPTYQPTARQAINSTLLYEIALQLIKSDNQPPPFIGAKFVPNAKSEIIISDILSNSPASTELRLVNSVIKSINSTKINHLSDVAYALLTVDAGNKIQIVFEEEGQNKTINLETSSCEDIDFENIAEFEIKKIKDFSENFGINSPKVTRLKDAEDLTIFSYRVSNKQKDILWRPIYDVSDLGRALQIMGMSGGGVLQVGTNNGKLDSIIINSNTLYLWH
jgi:S1-C subfamily serine protease